MRKKQSTRLKRPEQEVERQILHLALQSLLPEGQLLVVNQQTRTLSLLSAAPQIIMEQLLSENEMRMIVPILESYPHYCPYEILLAHISSNLLTQATIDLCRLRLQEPQRRGAWQQEMRPIRLAFCS